MSNASPLIVLGKVNQLELLTGLCDEMIIPEAVADEILQGAAEDPARQWLSAHGQQYVAASELIAPAVAGWDLGRGESAVLSWA